MMRLVSAKSLFAFLPSPLSLSCEFKSLLSDTGGVCFNNWWINMPPQLLARGNGCSAREGRLSIYSFFFFPGYKMFHSIVVYCANVTCIQWSCDLFYIACVEAFAIDMSRIKHHIRRSIYVPGCAEACAVHVIFQCERHFIFQCNFPVDTSSFSCRPCMKWVIL